MTANPRYKDREFRKASAALRSLTKAQGLPCYFCGGPIDTTLPQTEPGSFTAQHVDALAYGGSLLGELKPAHRLCNSRDGGNIGSSIRRARRERRKERHPGYVQ